MLAPSTNRSRFATERFLWSSVLLRFDPTVSSDRFVTVVSSINLGEHAQEVESPCLSDTHNTATGTNTNLAGTKINVISQHLLGLNSLMVKFDRMGAVSKRFGACFLTTLLRQYFPYAQRVNQLLIKDLLTSTAGFSVGANGLRSCVVRLIVPSVIRLGRSFIFSPTGNSRLGWEHLPPNIAAPVASAQQRLEYFIIGLAGSLSDAVRRNWLALDVGRDNAKNAMVGRSTIGWPWCERAVRECIKCC